MYISDYIDWLCCCDLPLDFNLAFLSYKLARVRAPTINLCNDQNILIPLVDFLNKKPYINNFHFDSAIVFETFVFSKFVLIVYKGDI